MRTRRRPEAAFRPPTFDHWVSMIACSGQDARCGAALGRPEDDMDQQIEPEDGALTVLPPAGSLPVAPVDGGPKAVQTWFDAILRKRAGDGRHA